MANCFGEFTILPPIRSKRGAKALITTTARQGLPNLEIPLGEANLPISSSVSIVVEYGLILRMLPK